MGVISELKGLFRVPNSAGPAIVYKDIATAIGDYPRMIKIGEFEQNVINKVCSLASRVKLEFDVPKQSFYKRWERKLEPAYTYIGSIQRYINLMLLNSVVDIVFIKENGIIKEVKFFVTHSNNHGFKRSEKVDYTDYIDLDKTYSVDKADISQVSRYADGNWSSPKGVRQAEVEYNKRVQRMNELTGVITTDEMNLTKMYGDKEKALTLAQWSKDLSTSSLAFSPQNHQFTSHKLEPAKLSELRENIMEAYCNFYELPSPLYYININAHTDVTLASAYTQFRLSIEPMFDQLTQALSEQFGIEVKADYSALQIAAGKETLELAQTGIYTINEMRKMKGLEPREDGDQYPQTAGTPDTSEDKNETKSDES